MPRIKRAVSLYSLQYQYLLGKMTLEDIFKFVHDSGIEGIEILPDQMLHGTPTPSEEVYAQWDMLVDKYRPTLACADVFLNTNLYDNRELTKRECVTLMKQEIEMAHRLGFKIIRMVSMVPAWILEPCLETAEKNDVCMCIEIHGGLGFGVPKTDEFINEMLRLNSPYIGIVPDTSLFCRRIPRLVSQYAYEVFGTNEELIRYAHETQASGTDFFALSTRKGLFMDPRLQSLVKDPAKDMFYAVNLSGYENIPLSAMDGLTKYIKHVHMKCYEMTPEGPEYSMDYKEVLQYLHDHDYDGFVATEYEGNRWQLPDAPIPELEQVTANQAYLKACLEEIQGQEA